MNKKENIKSSESFQKPAGEQMSKLPIIIEEAIKSWERRMRRATGDKYFNGYKELSLLVGLAPSTLRSYTDEFTVVTPTVENLVRICLAIQDNTPLEFISDFQKALFK